MWRSFLNKWLSQTSAAPNRGAEGERIAERYLVDRAAMRVVARNWRNPKDRREEIDLVMKEGDVLVFVEVKTRRAGALVPGYYAVNARKKRILARAVGAYLRGMGERPCTHRLDVVEVAWPEAGGASAAEVRHFANVGLRRRH